MENDKGGKKGGRARSAFIRVVSLDSFRVLEIFSEPPRPLDVTGERKTLTFPHYDSFPTLRLRNDALLVAREAEASREEQRRRGRSLNPGPLNDGHCAMKFLFLSILESLFRLDWDTSFLPTCLPTGSLFLRLPDRLSLFETACQIELC